jgi:hypothetical protein
LYFGAFYLFLVESLTVHGYNLANYFVNRRPLSLTYWRIHTIKVEHIR